MSRVPPRRSAGAVTNPPPTTETESQSNGAETSTSPPVSLPLSWKIALAIWLLAFVGLLVYEFGNLAWKLVMG